MATIISFAQLKGGEGKTTTTGAVGAALARRGFRVLLIDADPQANLTYGLGYKDLTDGSLYEALYGRYTAAEILLPVNGYGLLPASLSLSGVEMEMSSRIGRERLLEGLLAPLRTQYDFILIDCPPSIGLLTLNALTASDWILVPMQSEIHSLQGLRKILEILRLVKENQVNERIDLLGIVLNKHDRRKILHKDIFDTISEEFPGKLFDVTIRINIALAEAQTVGQDIFSYDGDSNGAADYDVLTTEILDRLKM
jgi:chromosome partitioning protein